MKNKLKQIFLLACALAFTGSLSGCVGSTTYGTGKSQNQHLVEDLSSILKPRKSNNGKIQYSNRTDLIKPTDVSQLPSPVEGNSVDNSNWVEEPEIRRAKIRAEAEALDTRAASVSARELTRKKRGAKVSFGGSSRVRSRADEAGFISLEERRRHSEAFRAKQAQISGVNVGTTAPRKYLTEPKIEYRTPSQDAPIGELGESELIKEKRRKTTKGFFDWLKPKS